MGHGVPRMRVFHLFVQYLISFSSPCGYMPCRSLNNEVWVVCADQRTVWELEPTAQVWAGAWFDARGAVGFRLSVVAALS